jgi:hypothetical protein
MPDFTRRAQDMQVVPVGEHRSSALEHAIHSSRDPCGDRLHAAGELLRARGFHQYVNVVVLDRVLHETEPPALARRSEAALQLAKKPDRSQRRQPTPNLQGDVAGMTPRERRARTVIVARARAALAARTRASTTPARLVSKTEIELSSPLRHCEQNDTAL